MLRPSDAAYTAAARPAGPPPTMQTSYRRCWAEVRRPSAPASSSADGEPERLALGDEHQREVGRRRPGEVEQPLRLRVALDVVPAVGHVVAGQEQLDLVAPLRPAVPTTRTSDVWSGWACRQSSSRSSTTGYSRSSGGSHGLSR